MRISGEKVRFIEMPSAELVKYLVDVQRPYLLKTFSTFSICGKMVMEANATEPGARLIHNVFEKLGKIVIDYLEQDEKVFFTYLEQFSSGKYLVDLPPRLLEMRKQHTSIKHLFKKLRVFTNNYAVPKQASAALKLCYAQLFNFEQDVLKHLFLEEDVLFPRLLELNERQVN